jgi:NADPH-ferrihemoprotein reductase
MTAATPEGKEMYQQWVLQENRSLLHILEDLPSCKPPLDLVCELLPRLQARYYSISSSAKVSRYPLIEKKVDFDESAWKMD